MRSIRSSLISKRCDVDEKCLFRASGSALIGWGLQGCKIRCMVFHSSLGLLDDKALLKKARLSDLILVLILLPTSHNLFLTLAEPVLCLKYLSTFLFFSSFLMSPLFSQGTEGRVILVLRGGTCLSRQDFKERVKNVHFLDIERNTTHYSSFLKAVPSNLFSLSSFLKAGKHIFYHQKGRKERGRKFGHETAREGEWRIKIVL